MTAVPLTYKRCKGVKKLDYILIISFPLMVIFVGLITFTIACYNPGKKDDKTIKNDKKSGIIVVVFGAILTLLFSCMNS